MSRLNTIKTLLREALTEATVEQDNYYYKIADTFYDDMINELKRKNYVIQQNGDCVFYGKEINLEYEDLIILFIPIDSNKTKPNFGGDNLKGGYSIGSYKHYKVILINNLREDKVPENGIDRSSFIHEFIHYLDKKRSNNYKPNFTDKTTNQEYFNEPLELNAYYQESVGWISKQLQNKNTIEQWKNKFNTPQEFSTWIFNVVLDKNFVSNLNDKNKRKIEKRIYNVYSQYLNENISKNNIIESKIVCPILNLTNDIIELVNKYTTSHDFLKAGGLDVEILDRLAFGFADTDIKTLLPNQLNIKWKDDLDNVKYEIQNSKLSPKQWASKINLSEPIDVSYENNKFYIEDGHHRYLAAKILNKPLNVNLEINENPTIKLGKNLGYDELMICIFNQGKKL